MLAGCVGRDKTASANDGFYRPSPVGPAIENALCFQPTDLHALSNQTHLALTEPPKLSCDYIEQLTQAI